MNTNISPSRQRLDSTLKAGIVQRAIQVVLMVVFQAMTLFLAAGELNWLWAWLFIGLNLVGISINMVLMLRCHPETIAERARATGMKDWDKVIGVLWAVMYFILTLFVAGIDERLGWTGSLATGLHLAGGAAFALGFALFSWAMISNAYFAAIVRIQQERGHTVCTIGPYRFVRHPGYVGAIIQSLAVPILLGSLWALIPGAIASLLMVARTALEDPLLRAELDGYEDYAQRVHYRLLPGLW